MRVWTYWEGPLWPHIEVCLETIAFHCRGLDYHHITPQNLDEYLPRGILYRKWRDLRSPAQRCDCIRAGLLYLYGGLYVDADTVMLQSPILAVEESKECCYLKWSALPERVLNGYIYCSLNSRVGEAWLTGVNYILSNSRRRLNWTALGEGLLTPLMRTYSTTTAEVPLDTWLPIVVDTDVQTFFSPLDWEPFVQPHTVAFGLNHSWMVQRRRQIMQTPPRLWAKSPYLIHRLLEHARSQLLVTA